MKVIYRITYPNGKIYVGQDLAGAVSYFGSANSRLIEADFTPDQCHDLPVRKEILWESKTATNQEVNAKEVEFILKLRSNDPAVGTIAGRSSGLRVVHHADARLWHPWLRINRVLRVMLHTRWTQLGDVVAECGVPGREVVVRCPGLARWRRTPWIREDRIERTQTARATRDAAYALGTRKAALPSGSEPGPSIVPHA